MKKTVKILTAGLSGVAILVLSVGCSSTYTIRTKDSREFQTKSAPDITDDRYVKFTTVAGQKVLLKQDEVSVISED
ncbi:MAG: YgdI/YgdR family lipoprotein [Candidatus Electrothrix communis]|jgi:hypothetical protein|nr:MAG: YgdI/YgdR family lipoprotein [Candidatus Electrothrix communis]